MTTTGTLRAPSGSLRFEVRGAGPLLLVIRAPVAAVWLVPLAEALASDFTVVTYDPGGVQGGSAGSCAPEISPELEADDAAVILDELGGTSAYVFGTCGGAVTGLAMVVRHPGRVRTLLAHEPPLSDLLPNGAVLRSRIDEIVRTFHQEGAEAAWSKFVASPVLHESGQDMFTWPSLTTNPDSHGHLCKYNQWTLRHALDILLSDRGPARVVIGMGVDSGGLSAHSAMALAGLLDRIRWVCQGVTAASSSIRRISPKCCDECSSRRGQMFGRKVGSDGCCLVPIDVACGNC